MHATDKTTDIRTYLLDTGARDLLAPHLSFTLVKKNCVHDKEKCKSP
jgi:hypothetical protein